MAALSTVSVVGARGDPAAPYGRRIEAAPASFEDPAAEQRRPDLSAHLPCPVHAYRVSEHGGALSRISLQTPSPE